MSDDGWEDVTDPLEVKKVLGVQAARGMGGATAGVPAGGGASNVGAAMRGQARAKVVAARMLRRQLENVESLYGQTLKGGGPGALLEYLPTPKNKKFNAAADGLLPLARQAFRVPGSGADSDKELQVLIKSLLPSNDEYDEVNEQRMAQLRRMIDDTETEWAPVAGIEPDAVTPTIRRLR